MMMLGSNTLTCSRPPALARVDEIDAGPASIEKEPLDSAAAPHPRPIDSVGRVVKPPRAVRKRPPARYIAEHETTQTGERSAVVGGEEKGEGRAAAPQAPIRRQLLEVAACCMR